MSEVVSSNEAIDQKYLVLFHFGPHDTEYDAQQFRDHMGNADVYAPELPKLPPENKKVLTRVANGDRNALERVQTFSEFGYTSFINILGRRPGKKLAIEVFDVPRTQYWINTHGEMVRLYNQAFVKLTPEETLRDYENGLARIAEIQSERDSVISSNIMDYIKSRDLAQNWHPNRPSIILVSLGSLHTPVAQKLQEEGVPVAFTANSAVFDDGFYYSDGVIKLFQAGEKPTPELLKRAFVASIINRKSLISANDTTKKARTIKKIVDQYSDEGIDFIVEKLVSTANLAGKEVLEKALEYLMEQSVGRPSLDNEGVEKFLSV